MLATSCDARLTQHVDNDMAGVICQVEDDVAGVISQALPLGSPPPGKRVIDNKHSNRDSSVAHLECECSYRRADSVRRLNVSGVRVRTTTKCAKPLSDLVTLSAKLSKWIVLICRAGRLSTQID